MTEEKKFTHGGAREGAGREPVGRKAWTYRLTDDEKKLIDPIVAEIKKRHDEFLRQQKKKDGVGNE